MRKLVETKRVKTFPIFSFCSFTLLSNDKATEHRPELENRIWQQKNNNGHLCSTKRTAKQNKFGMNFHLKKVMFLVRKPLDVYKLYTAIYAFENRRIKVKQDAAWSHEPCEHEGENENEK